MLLPSIGVEGQRRLQNSHALIVGCGALGSAITDALARAGVGTLTIIDRDVVEITNLQRQVLFDENDVANAIPKAEAAQTKLARINSRIKIRAVVDDFNHRNADSLIDGVDIILDGLDNFEARYLLNDLAVARGLPYIYGGAVGTSGLSMPILPHARCRVADSTSNVQWSVERATPCLRCVFPTPPAPGSAATCDTAGVLGSAVAWVAAHQTSQAIKLLTGHIDALDRSLLSLDLWENQLRRIDPAQARGGETCPCCDQGLFPYMQGERTSEAVSMCGRGAVQIMAPDHINRKTPGVDVDLKRMAHKLAEHGTFTQHHFLLQGELIHEIGIDQKPIELTLFPTGRAIFKGTEDLDLARSLYARYVGM